MGILHFDKLPPSQLLDVVGNMYRGTYDIHVKYDGHFIEFGNDVDGFYTKTKFSEKYRSVDDWPKECWTASFRLAHKCLEHRYGNSVYFETTAEILDSHNPNVIQYFDDAKSRRRLTIVLHNSKKVWPHSDLKQYECDVYQSVDGKTRSLEVVQFDGVVVSAKRCDHPMYIGSYLINFTKTIRKILATVKYEGLDGFTIVTIPLNKRFDAFTPAEWKVAKPIIKDIREKVIDEVRQHAKVLSNGIQGQITDEIYNRRYEGFVFRVKKQYSDEYTMVKMVAGEHIAKGNRYVHFIKNALVGGRRPSRPCFLSRTAHWTPEKQIAYLERFADRYVAYFAARPEFMIHYNSVVRSMMTTYSLNADNYHTKNLGMICDLIERIKDGRASIQGSYTKNIKVGNPTHSTVAG